MEFDSGTETSMHMNSVNPDMAPVTVEIDRKSAPLAALPAAAQKP